MTAGPESVSRREAEVLALLGEHLMNAQIARRLHISVRTVENHVSSLLRKYGVPDRQALADIAKHPEQRPGQRPEQRPAGHPGRPAGQAGIALPVWRTGFVGRAHERDAVLAMLGTRRLVTLVGPGGVGKTRLAAVVAEAAGPGFPLGGVFADLVPVGDEQVTDAVARALGVSERPGQSLLDAVVSAFGEDRRLLVLDNCEHLLDAAACFADELLARCPGLTILATSRERLGLPDEQVVPISPLPLASDAEALFTERAAAVDPGFAAPPALIAEICARLDGLPLAIELAAARCASLGAEGVLTGLDDALRLLAGSRRPDERHRSLRAVLGWSHDLLDADERALFPRLGVFAGTFDLDAVASVTPGAARGALADVLGRLVDKSLAGRAGQAGRWRLLETVRAYALERLTSDGDADEVRHLHLRWASHTAQQLAARCHEQGERRGGALNDVRGDARGGARADPADGEWWRAD
ncbi:ATPase, partial [Nonomuraea sp. NN258]|uniref:ATP-binding protein n=1 Tax=Nonomuraea antri TaxID=2730852 RepID=UPI001C2C73FE